jgi:serine/threonine protein kinase
MTMNATAPCPECGKPLPAGSDVCPACLMAQAIASRTLDGESGPREVPPPPAPEEIAEKFPQFEILECLGRGGMGVVYKARQKSLNRLVAIKILAPEREREARFAGRFAKEAEMLAKLSHPHIVTIHDFGETGGLYYLVMEFINGVNLRDLLREGKMAPEQALAIVPPICDALQFAHDHGIVHRDIKPENILLDREGRVKIADFGIATLAGDAAERAGTPHYMAPEQSGGAKAIDHRADVYALGVVLYEMLTGERPTAFPVAPSQRVQIDVRLDEVVLRALAHQPERRFQSAGDFNTVLGEVTREVTTAPPPAEPAMERPPVMREEEPPITGHRIFELAAAAAASWAIALIAMNSIPQFKAWAITNHPGLVVASLILGIGVTTGILLGLLAAFRRRLGSSGEQRLELFRQLFHFAPALLLAIAWWTSGLERGAVLILSVLVVAVIILKAVSRAKPPEVGSDAAARWALGLLLAGVVGTPLLLSFTTKEEGVLFAGGACLIASLILAIISWRTRIGRTLTLIWAGLFVIATVMGVFYQSRNAQVRDEALARARSQRLENAELAVRLEQELKNHRPGHQDSRSLAPSSQGAIMIDGKSYPSISAALDTAPENAVIRLGEGIYRERVVIDKPVTIIGAGWEKTRIELEDSDSQPLQIPNVPAEATQSTLLIGTGGEVILEGLTISRIGSPPEGDILSPYSWASAVAIYQGSVVLRNCALTGSPGSLLSARNASVSMEGCLVAAAWHAGITLYDAQSVDIRRCVVRNCRYAGIVIGGRSRQVTVAGNHITGSAWHGIQYDQDCAPVITGNVIRHHAQNGIIAFGNTNGEITGNIIADNETAGITLRDNSHDQITRNLFIGNLRESIFLADKSSPQIRGNIFSGKGIHQQPVHGTIEYGSALVAQNVFWDMTRPWERWTEKGPVAFPLPEGNRIEDPGLGKDFALPAGSPLPGLGIGPETPPPSAANFPIQPEETAIVPDGDTRNAKGWKRPR